MAAIFAFLLAILSILSINILTINLMELYFDG